MVSFPIPDKQSPIRFVDICWQEYNLGPLVFDLTKGRIHPTHGAHLDPDINSGSLKSRHPDWKPIFGQTGAAQGHLRKNSIQRGDLFLFFGLFRSVKKVRGNFVWDRRLLPRHVIWGWLQIEEILKLDGQVPFRYAWANYHPHLQRKPETNDTLYVAKRYLDLPGLDTGKLEGAGIFPYFSERLALTPPIASSPTQWELPKWCFPRDGQFPFTYHSNLTRWTKTESCTRLKAVARGQEFILDTKDFPEAIEWIRKLLA